MVRRVFVEKRPGFDVEAGALFNDLKENLNIDKLTNVRVINRYDIEGVDDDTFKKAKYNVFSEAVVDEVIEEIIELNGTADYFAVEYLPGQFDQRADSAEQCIQLISMASKPTVRFAKVIVLYGDLDYEVIDNVKAYCINPVDSREAKWAKPDKLEMQMDVPKKVACLEGFISLDNFKLEEFRKEEGLAMSMDDLKFVQNYFAETEKREPTVTEMRVIDTYWSDHCRHTTFMTKISDVEFEPGVYSGLLQEEFKRYLKIREDVYGNQSRDVTLMDMAVIGAKYIKKIGLADDLDESDEINACSFKVKADIDGKPEDWLVMFKNETHNHPTEIEPFGGAATCLGGAIRDPLSGRVYVYQAMRVTGSADPRAKVSDTLPGKLPQRKITTEAANGYSSYGNQIGLSTGLVSEVYHNKYMAKRMEVGAVIGAAPAKNVVRMKPAKGDCIILVGGRTGRDGCGGATGSSKEHTEESIFTCGAEVQKGNPPVERNIQRLFRREEVSTLIKRCNDFGAGGVSVAIGELADSIDVDLDCIPKKYEGLDGTELAISESQERMVVVVSENDLERFIAYADEENLEAVQVAEVTDTGRFRMYWRKDCILDLSRGFLDTNGVKQETSIYVKESFSYRQMYRGSIMPTKIMLGQLNSCSQKGLTERFDSTIGAGSVLMPLGGMYQLTPALGMAGKLPLLEGNTNTITLMTYGFDPFVSELSPYHGALYAVLDSAAKITAMGGDYSKARLSFQEYFESLGKDPQKWAKPFGALLGALRAQIELKIPAIGGKDSMSGTFMDISVPPTLISFAVAVTEAEKVISPEIKRTGDILVLLRCRYDEMLMPDFEHFKANMDRVKKLNESGKILAANTVERGGMFISILKMAVGNMIGVSLRNIKQSDFHGISYGSLVLEISGDEKPEELFEGLDYQVLGVTTKEEKYEYEIVDDNGRRLGLGVTNKLSDLIEGWSETLENVFPTKAPHKTDRVKAFVYEERSTYRPSITIAKPRVFIPVFPGTNCEVDSKRAFDRAGAESTIQVLRNLTYPALDDSIKTMAENIRNSQILMLPGGFSGGDEPDGSAKFITAVFRNPLISEAVEDLLTNRDGLILGICNGFQALIKLGLVPYGRITDMNDESPTLTYNSIGRHVSCLVSTRIASVKSPWLSNVNVGDIHTIPVSHGEGRFIANDSIIKQLEANGQIASQYVDPDGFPTYDVKYNPNNSMQAIEGLLSPDGRIFGKMGHSERIGENLYRNVPGNKDQKIFEAGVLYFK